MSRPISAAALALVVALAGCGGPGDDSADGPDASPSPASSPVNATPAPPAEPPAAARSEDLAACGADKVGEWLNALPSADVKAQIATAVGERRIRYYRQGDPITMDFSASRLNVELGEDGRIKLFRCG